MLGTSVKVQPRSAPKNSHASAGRGVIMLNQQNSPGLRTPLATDDETTFRRAFSISMVSSFSGLYAPLSMPQGRTSPDRADTSIALFLPVGCGHTHSS